jgi:hypothetical protein
MALSDSARDFWDRISPRERMLVVVAAIAVPVTIALWLGFAIHDGLTAMEQRNERTRKALDVVAELKSRGPIQKDPNEVTLPSEPIALETYLNNAATAAGFALKGTSPRPAVTKNGVVTTSVTFQLEDLEIEKLKAFLQEVETKQKVVFVTHLDVKRDFRDKKKLDANVEVSAYSRPADSKPAEGGGSGSAAGSGKGL